MGDENKTGFESGNATWTMQKLPAVIQECCDFLESNGFDDEGIFRVTGSFRDINLLKAEYSNGNSGLDLSEVSPHSVAGVLTHYFNETEEPLVPFELYDFCIECMELEPSSRLAGIKTMIYTLPIGNFLIMKRFMKTLTECAKLQEVNKMGAQNLAIALSPTLVRPLEATIETLISHGDTLAQLIAIIIENYTALFDTPFTNDLPETTPDAFFEVLLKAEEDMNKRLPENFTAQFSPKVFCKQKASDIPDSELPISRFQAIWRGRRLRRKLEGIKFAYQTQYNQACWDYMRRENNFVHAMKRAIKDFETSLGDNYEGKRIRKLQALHATANISWQSKNAEAEVHSIVSGFKAIIEIHQMLYEEILTTWETSWPCVKGMGAVFVAKFPLFIVYNMYVEMYCRVDGLMHADDANPELEKWMKATAGSSQYRRTLGEVLRLPFEHLTGCSVPIQRFLNCVLTFKEDINDTNNIVKAFALLQRLRTSICAVDRRISFQRANVLEASILGLRDDQKFASLSRRLLKHGPISINKQWMYVFLFEDICVVCHQNKESFTFEHTIKMKGTTVTDTSRLGFLLHSTLNDYNMLNKRAEDKVSFYVAFQQVSEHWNSDRFGVPLNYLLDREKHAKNIKKSDESIPAVVEMLATYLRGVSKETNSSDFFCLGCDMYSVTALRNRLNSVASLEEVDLAKYPLPVVVEVLRLFLMELPTPLLDRAKCSDIFEDRSETKINLAELYRVIQSLSEREVKLLFYFCELLADTYLHPSILAQTWGNTLYRSYIPTVSESLSITGVTTFMHSLLMNYADLCSPTTGEEFFNGDGEVKAEETSPDGDGDNDTMNDDDDGEEEEDEMVSPSASEFSDSNVYGDDSCVDLDSIDFVEEKNMVAAQKSSLVDISVVRSAAIPPPIGAAAATLPPPPAALPPKPLDENSTLPAIPPKILGPPQSLPQVPHEVDEGPPQSAPPPPPEDAVPVARRESSKGKKKSRRMSVKNVLFRSKDSKDGNAQEEY
mmetsp:Transcript_135210/g.201073  ORF Transcript_135210/g.201073 Transcript_135210/m.201073 type:complete len:1004 (-) Transcript_135210:37-3048(-)